MVGGDDPPKEHNSSISIPLIMHDPDSATEDANNHGAIINEQQSRESSDPGQPTDIVQQIQFRSYSASKIISPTRNQSTSSVLSQESENFAVTHTRLQTLEVECDRLRELLDDRESECARLKEQLLQKELESCQFQNQVDGEIHDLTEHLFKEAYKMVGDAEEKRVSAEKLVRENKLKVDMLEAEVTALKILVLHTPANSSSPGQSPRSSMANLITPSKRFGILTHRRQRSDGESQNNQPESPKALSPAEQLQQMQQSAEIDPVLHQELVQWRDKHNIEDRANPFLRRIYQEDILPCLSFQNQQLASELLKSIEQNGVVVEQVKENRPQTRNCSLSLVPRNCTYRLQLVVAEQHDATLQRGDLGEATTVTTDEIKPSTVAAAPIWHYISSLARNRIASVCDFFTYLRYLNQGLIKCNVHDAYWEVIRLRRNMALARLGLPYSETFRS